GRRHWLSAAGALLVLCAVEWPAAAQTPGGWEAQTGDSQAPDPAPSNTTVVPRSPGAAKLSGGRGPVFLSAYLTDASPLITQGLVWRVFRDAAGSDGKLPLVSTHREANPILRLEPGNYRINVALGRANLTRRIAVAGDQAAKERFVLNAGG